MTDSNKVDPRNPTGTDSPDWWSQQFRRAAAIAQGGFVEAHEIRTLKDRLQEYAIVLRRDFCSRHNDNPEYSVEDDMFLGDQISSVAYALFKLKEAGY